MALIDWSEAFETGITSLDFEHREMIELLNRLAASLSAESSNDAIADFLGEVYTKISAHFALEEQVMQEKRYPHYPAHKDDHENLLDELREIMEQNEQAVAFTTTEEALAARLKRWFEVHFQDHDARLHALMD